MWIKCECQHCGGHLEFGREHVGVVVDCPHCGQPTPLIVPPPPPQVPRITEIFGQRVKMYPQIQGYLLELRDRCLLTERVPGGVMKELAELAPASVGSREALLALIQQRWPRLLLSEDYRKRKRSGERQMRRIRGEGEFAPPVPVPEIPARGMGEADATPKQLRFLRNLGVRDEALLGRLGKAQAGFLIDYALAYRAGEGM